MQETVPDKQEPQAEHRDLANAKGASDDIYDEAAANGQCLTGYETLGLWETAKKFKVNSLTCFAICFSAATDGYQIGINGNIIANPGFVQQFATETSADGTPALASPILSAWGSIMSVGQIIGMTTLPFVSDRFGRKVAMYSFWFVIALSVMFESIATRWELWLVGKLLAGVGVGCMQSTIPTYISEVSPTSIRGALLMCYSLWWSLGGFFAPVALQILSETDATNYKVPIYTQWAQVGIMLIVYLVVPESPTWLVSKGKFDEAKKTLSRLHCDVPDYNVDRQLQVLTLSIDHERATAAEQRAEQWYSIFKGTDGYRTLVALWTLLSQQFIGLTLFATYSSYFFQQGGIEDPFKATCITSSISLVAGLCIVYAAERLGRRVLSCGGTTICWVCNIAVGILGVTPKVNATNYLFILFACIWWIGLVANGATGWGFIGEISSQRLRPYTAGFGAAMTCVVGVIMNVLTPYMVNTNQWNWGLKTAWFYVGIGLPFTVAIWFIIPETAGRTSAELDELFERKIRPWRFHKTTTMTQRAVEAGTEKLNEEA
ncbi:general substrate transporter [Dactylonectria estremocensis]|uniref:General substrate transporter n=1 Tax=Dactylonectria estremocensis TaxID=1079267 RepID=A0A9P9DWQ2_9HYPO|nr:general substrate transporter [Dactylonectria estremocensis]